MQLVLPWRTRHLLMQLVLPCALQRFCSLQSKFRPLLCYCFYFIYIRHHSWGSILPSVRLAPLKLRPYGAIEIQLLLHSALAAAQCIVIGPVCGFLCVCVFVCLSVCGSVTTITRIACIDPHQTGFVGKASDQLQLIKFWPSRAPGKGVCGGTKIFGSALLQPARSVCVFLSAFSLLLVFLKLPVTIIDGKLPVSYL